MVIKLHSKEPSFDLCKWMYTYELCIFIQLHTVSWINSTFSPRLATPRLQELKVLPRPLACICLLSCFCSLKTRGDAGWRSAELQGPRNRVVGGLCWRQGPGTLWGTSLDSWAQRGQAEERGTCARSARAAPAPAPAPLALLLSVLHAQAAERDQQLLFHTGSGGVCSNTRTSYAKEEAIILLLVRAFSATLPALFRSYRHFSTVLCSTPLRGHGWLLKGCGLMAVTCCPRWYIAQNTQSFILLIDWTSGPGCVKDEGSDLDFSVPSVGREWERWKVDDLFLLLVLLNERKRYCMQHSYLNFGLLL